jgi:hypothetical protein
MKGNLNNQLSLNIHFIGKELFVIANIGVKNPITQLNFILNNNFIIDTIKAENNQNVKWEKIGEVKPEFRSICQKIAITNEILTQNIIITYHGIIKDSWYNVITENIKAVSFYSTWYPQDLSIKEYLDKVTINNSEEYFIVKGIYDNNTKTWTYGGQGYDPFNLIIYNKKVLKKSSNKYLNIYYIEQKIEEQVNKANTEYEKIIKFYNGNLFEKREISKLDIACVSPAITTGGGYRRKDLMVCCTLGENDMEIAWLLAHETAHIWCEGAQMDSWEDWLNETTAEWASMLYALDQNNSTLFHFIIDQKIERVRNYQAIKTKDKSRPDGVHDKGSVLFYTIYKKYGVEKIKKIVNGFARLKVKNTDNYIKMIRAEISEEIALEIEKGIEV